MARFKQIMMFAVLIIIFIFFSDFMIKVGIRNTYKTISGEIKSATPEIVMTDVKTTDVNGYAKGIIKNNTEQDIEKVYIKLDLFSKVDTNMGTEYYEVTNLKAGESKEFEIKYKYANVKKYEINCVNEK